MKHNALKEILIDSKGNKTGVIIDYFGVEKQLSISEVLELIESGFKLKDCTITDNDIRLYPENNSKFNNLTDSYFDDWYVLEYLGHSHWLCECSCGAKRSVLSKSLLSGKSSSCGHNTNAPIDLINRKFGEWKVLKRSKRGYWTCGCSCGTIKDVWGGSLTNGESTSCGHATNKFIDLKDTQIGDWSVLEYAGNGYWICKCNCGTVKQVEGAHLRNGVSLSCGHATSRLKDLTGMQIGLWTVKKKTHTNGHNTFYHCVCDCGREREVNGQSLRTGQSTSCGQCSRTDEQLEIVSTAERFNSYLYRMYAENNKPLSLRIVAEQLGISVATVKLLVNKFNSQCYIVESESGISSAEKELRDYIEALCTYEITYNSRQILFNTTGKNLELDIYVPERQVAVEYNGVYWHSSIHKDAKYHLNKTLACKNKNIHLIHIFEHEYQNEALRPILHNIIKQSLGLITNKIHARKTVVKQPKLEEVRDFLNENHLQGYVNYTTALGLYYNNDLVELMTFGKPRYNSNYDVELLRLCTKRDYVVIGGAQKLFKYFIKTNNCKSVVSYCDISKFTGKVYAQLGMTFEGLTTVSYSYVNSHLHELHRLSCTKTALIMKGWGTEEQSEEEIMRNHGYYKLYNCGNAKYVYNVS